MEREKLLDGINAYDKGLKNFIEDPYKEEQQKNVYKLRDWGKLVQEYSAGRYNEDISKIVDDKLFNVDNTKNLKNQGKKIREGVKFTKEILELKEIEADKVFDKLDDSIKKTNSTITRTLGEAYDALSSAKSGILAAAKAMGLDTEKSFTYEFYNPDIYRLSHAGPDFMSNMFTAYLSNTSWAARSAITQRPGPATSYTGLEINQVFAFRVTELNLPRLSAKEGPTFTFANQQIKKISAISANDYRGSITVRLDHKLGMWFLDSVGGTSQSKFGEDDDLNTIYPKVFFPNGATSYGALEKDENGQDVRQKSSFDNFWFPAVREDSMADSQQNRNAHCMSQNLIVSMSNIGGFRPDDIAVLMEWIKESKVEAQGLQKWLNAINDSFAANSTGNKESPYAMPYGEVNNARNIFPVYVFKNVRFITKPSISLSRDNDDIITAKFDFVYSQVVKAFNTVKVEARH